jgi:hypothetical protein
MARWGHEDSTPSGGARRIHPEAEDSSLGVGPVLGQGGLLMEESRVGRGAGMRCSRLEFMKMELGCMREKGKRGKGVDQLGQNSLEKKNGPGPIQRIVAC